MTAAERPQGEPWSPFRPISSAAGTLLVQDARVAVDAGGRATASWQRTIRRGDRNVATVVTADQRASGAWRSPVQVSERGLVAFASDLAVNADGTAIALWTRPLGVRRAVGAAIRLRPGGRWRAPERVTPFLREFGGPGAAEDVRLDGRGTATAYWVSGGRLRASDRHAGAPATVRLTARQLLVNQRLAQAAIRRAAALRRVVESGLDSSHLRPGALAPERFGPSVETQGGLQRGAHPARAGIRDPGSRVAAGWRGLGHPERRAAAHQPADRPGRGAARERPARRARGGVPRRGLPAGGHRSSLARPGRCGHGNPRPRAAPPPSRSRFPDSGGRAARCASARSSWRSTSGSTRRRSFA